MQILAIDTASPWPGVSLLAGDALFEEALPSDRRSSEALLPAIARVLAAANARLGDCTRLAVCSGPGSFTGIRIGLATAWALSRASGVPVEAVSTLECMAEAASDERPGSARAAAHEAATAQGAAAREAATAQDPAAPLQRVVAVLDAGRGELVVERFALEGPRARSLSPAMRVPVAAIAAVATGDPLVELPSGLSGAPALAPKRTPASALALAVGRAPRSATSAPAAASYSRPSAAEEKHRGPA